MLPRAERYLWIVTADLKDLHVKKGRRFGPLLEILSDLVNEGVAVRLFHARESGPRFRGDFDRYPSLIESDLFERIICPRIHTKAIIAATPVLIPLLKKSPSGASPKYKLPPFQFRLPPTFPWLPNSPSRD